MLRNLLFLLPLLFLFWACTDSTSFDLPAPASPERILQPWSQDVNRWSWDGETPELLLGASSFEAPFLEKEWKEELNYLKKAGGNYVRISLPALDSAGYSPFGSTEGGSGYDLTTFSQDYWKKLETYLTYASGLGVVVEIDVWDLRGISGGSGGRGIWMSSESEPLIKATLEKEFLPGEHPFFQTVPGSMQHREKYGAVLDIQRYFVDRMLTTTLPFTNVIYNVQVPDNSLIPWMVYWAKHIEASGKGQGRTALINAGIVPERRVNVARFNESVLRGAAVAFHRPKPNGNGMNGLAQASIRGLRVVERHLKFHELRPAPDLLLEDDTEATAATDGKGNYLIYLPAAGSVNLSPDWEAEVPVDVTVVGYLGTQRTEVLQPPYGDSFRLYTEEEKGGWMILKPQR